MLLHLKFPIWLQTSLTCDDKSKTNHQVYGTLGFGVLSNVIMPYLSWTLGMSKLFSTRGKFDHVNASGGQQSLPPIYNRNVLVSVVPHLFRLGSEAKTLVFDGFKHNEECLKVRVFLRRFRDPIRVPRIRENYHRVPSIRENRVPTDPYRVPNIFLKKKLS